MTEQSAVAASVRRCSAFAAPVDAYDRAVRALRVIQERVRAAVFAEHDAISAVQRGHRELDATIARALAQQPSACSAGCSYCCHVHVDATRAEVDVIARHLREHRSTSELAQLVDALALQVRAVSTMDDDRRWAAKIPCALLGKGGRCTIYDVRPVRCRAFHSYSIEACHDAFIGPIEPDPQTNIVLERACDAAERGFERALAERGIATEPVLLEAALLDALTPS